MLTLDGVRAILANTRYTGRQVWNCQRKDEVLLDVHEVALGHDAEAVSALEAVDLPELEA